jgi:hypothetical protein
MIVYIFSSDLRLLAAAADASDCIYYYLLRVKRLDMIFTVQLCILLLEYY